MVSRIEHDLQSYGSNLYAGVISGALLYIRDDFEQIEKSTVLQVLDSILAICSRLASHEKNQGDSEQEEPNRGLLLHGNRRRL